MIKYTDRLDKALRVAARAHAKSSKPNRKGSDIPYIIHPFGVMLIAGNVTDDEDVLIACLLHDVLEDVDKAIYGEPEMLADFDERVVAIVKDVSKSATISSWRERSNAYLDHLENKASEEAVIVSTADKIHNLTSILIDYKEVGEELWQRFTTKSVADQLWWYESILEVVTKRSVDKRLQTKLAKLVEKLKLIANS